jgi:RNA polymerase sigma-70 factor (ECF subfamily)
MTEGVPDSAQADACGPATPRVLIDSTRAAHDFDHVYRAWFSAALGWLRAASIPESEIEDVAQEMFLVVRRKLEAFDGRNLPGWLYTIAAQTASDHRRRAWFRRLLRRAPATELEHVATSAPDPLRSCEAAEARAQLRTLLARLKEPQRVAFWLFEIEGYSAAEAAALLGVTETTISMRVHHARNALYGFVERQQRKERQ